MKIYLRSSIPFVIILLIVIACGSTKKTEQSTSIQKEQTVKTQNEESETKTETLPKNKTTDSTPKKKKQKKTTDSFSENSTPKTEKQTKPKTETDKPRYRIGAICCDGSRSSATGRGACSHHGGVCQWLYNR